MASQIYTFILTRDYSISIIENNTHCVLHKSCPNRTFQVLDTMTINKFIENITALFNYQNNIFTCNLPVCVILNNNIATVKYIHSMDKCIFTRIGSNINIQPYNTFDILKKKINLEYEAIKEELTLLISGSIINENDFNNMSQKIITNNIYNTPTYSPVYLNNYNKEITNECTLEEINLLRKQKLLGKQSFQVRTLKSSEQVSIQNEDNDNDGDNEDNDIHDEDSIKSDRELFNILDINSPKYSKKLNII
jgi:hypothetical protein